MRNVGIFAHVDAGKTTTTEHILYESGRIRILGSVDSGTSQTDWLDVERERGISVRSAATAYMWKDVAVNLIDTPGHVDFLSEVERPLRVIDGAVLILSAVEGVQAQTEAIWHALRSLGIPTLLYINKMDRIGADAASVLDDIHKLLSPLCLPVQIPSGETEHFTGASSLWQEPLVQSDAGDRFGISLQKTIETMAEFDERMLHKYIEGEAIPADEVQAVLRRKVREAAVFPVLFGVSSRGIGIIPLMEAIIEYLPEPAGDEEAPLSGVVFRIERDKAMGKLAIVRVYEGTVRNRDVIVNATQGIEEKVTQIRKVDGRRIEDTGVVYAGDIAALCGLSRARIGDVLGSPGSVPAAPRLAVPLLTVQVHAAGEPQYPALAAALHELTEEDPLLDVQWLQDERELHIKVMGSIQLEILESLLLSRFGLRIVFGQPSVIYKETPARQGEGYIAYTMPKPCWAVLRFHIEPGARGSGLVYNSIVRPDDLLARYQNEVERRIPEALQQGLYGWEVVDLKITLLEGQHHVWHTHPLDFAVATPMGLMNGLAATGTLLLEPLLHFRIAVPEEFGGRILNDLVQMRAVFDSPAIVKDRLTVEGILPVASSIEYSLRLNSLTGGKGTITTFFAGYQPCPPEVKVMRPRRGADPLDQARYILSARKALG